MVESFHGALTFQQDRGLWRREYYGGLFTALPFYIAYFAGFIFGRFSSSSNGVPSPTSAFIDGFPLLLLALNVSLTRSLRASYVLLDVNILTVGSKISQLAEVLFQPVTETS